MRRAWQLTSKVVSWMLLGAVVAGGLALIAVPKATGAKPLTVLSGSMAPTYDPGDVVVVRPTRARELEVGDVVTFQPVSDDPKLTTHRVVEVTYGSEGVRYVTQGDANDTPDPEPVRPVQVKGEVWYSVPLVGYLSVWMATGVLGDAVRWFAIGLILYGGWFFAAGLRERLRRPEGAPA
jgi:signal peptidase